MGLVRVGHFTGTAAEINLDIGFVPDWFRMISASGAPDVDQREWFRRMGSAGQANIVEGFEVDGATGVTADFASGEGISAYDTSVLRVRLPHPDGSPNKWAGANAPVAYVVGATQPTARSTTVVGGVTKPSTPNGYIYECTTAAGVYDAEPTWPTTPGESVDAGDNIWICRREDTYMGGHKGVTLVAAMTEDGIECFYVAVKADDSVDQGDAAAFSL